MAQPRIVVSESRRGEAREVDPRRIWKWVAWLSALLTLVTAGDFALAWVPFRFGVPEWEFATVAQTVAGLPLATIGLGGLVLASMALGNRRMLIAAAVALLLLALIVFVALTVFLLDVPLALRASQGPASLGVQKAIAKTLFLGVAFGTAYAIGGVAALKQAKTPSRM